MLGLLVAIAVVGATVVALQKMPEPASPDLERIAGTDGSGVEQGKLYRWRADDGVIHIESTPPPDEVEYEVITYAVEPPAAAGSRGRPKDQTPAPWQPGDSFPTGSPLAVYSPEGIMALVNRVDEIARRLDERRRLLAELQRQM